MRKQNEDNSQLLSRANDDKDAPHWALTGFGIFTIALVALVAGVSAGIVGILLLLMPTLSWEWQFLLFALFSIATVVLWRRWLRKHPTPSE